jgi:hypothetical protein
MKTLAAAFLALSALIALAGCERAQQEQVKSLVREPPAPPTGAPPTFQPRTELAKEVEVAAMPLPGQNNDHETLALLNSARAEALDVLKDPELARLANSDAALEAWRQRKLKELQGSPLRRQRP